MKTSFTYSLTEQDYIVFERFSFKRTYQRYLLIALIIDAGLAIFNFYSFKNLAYLVPYLFFGIVMVFVYYYQYTNTTEKKVRTYVGNDKTYLKPIKATISDKKVVFETESDEANQMINICPFNVIDMIFESDDYFYFALCSEVRILPKRDIPNDVHGEVLRLIKSKKNVMYVK